MAALSLVRSGTVGAVSCMVGGLAWRRPWTAALRDVNSDVAHAGLHLDFTEKPLVETRESLPSFVLRSQLHLLTARAVRAEIVAQLDAFERALDRAPRYVDGHQHVHQLPVVRDELLNELTRRYRGALPWLRLAQPARDAACTPGERVKAVLIAHFGARGLNSEARRLGFALSGRLLGVYNFSGGRERFERRLRAWLRSAAEGDILMCHPGVADETDVYDPIARARQVEFDVLAGGTLGRLAREAGVLLGPFRLTGRSTAAVR